MVDPLFKIRAKRVVWTAYRINQITKAINNIQTAVALLKSSGEPTETTENLERLATKSFVKKILLKRALTLRLSDLINLSNIQVKHSLTHIPLSDLRRGYILLDCIEEEPVIGTHVLYLTHGTVIEITQENINNDYLLPEINALKYHNIADLG